MKNIFLKSFSSIVFFLISFMLSGCDKIVDPTGLAPSEMSATSNVEGSFFAKGTLAVDEGTTYLVNAEMEYQPISGKIVITMKIPKGTVPYTITVGTDATAYIDYCLNESAGACTTFRAFKGTGIGTIKITSLSPNLEGTFSGTLPQLSGSGTRIITGGEFKATF